MVLRHCHTSDLKFGIWFFLKSDVVRQNNFFAKRLKSGKKIDVQNIYAKYAFLF